MICDYRCWCISIDILLAVIVFACSFFGLVITITAYPQVISNQYFIIGLIFLSVDIFMIILWTLIILIRKHRRPNTVIYELI